MSPQDHLFTIGRVGQVNQVPVDTDFPQRYTAALAQQIELHWQDEWERRGTFHTPNPSGRLTDGSGAHAAPDSRPFFVMDMFPYPSGAGLHVGHPLGYIATDVVGRFRRMRGDNVLHALGFDAFGLPAEQHAVATGQHPRLNTENNISIMSGQLRRLGLAHDSRRSFATIDESYVRWTQWIFREIFSSWYDPDAVRPDGGLGQARPISELEAQFAAGTREVPANVVGVPAGSSWADLDPAARAVVLSRYRLAYLSDTAVNWAPGLGTVLANEEVTADGRSERGNVPVFRKNLRQWNMRITAYADRLIDDLEHIDWPDKVRSMQRHWIGRSVGATVTFEVVGGQQVEVFTTRPDTLFGATFMVVAPEHPLLDEVPAHWPDGTNSSWTGDHDTPGAAVAAYRAYAAGRTAVERQADAGRKSGVFTGHLAVNPVTGESLPIFTADYVLMGYGTGAIMAVPGGDTRDYEFAQTFDLPVIYTVAGDGDGPRTGDGLLINSAGEGLDLNGQTIAAAKDTMIAWLVANGVGSATVTYRLRDWLFSRQRYWGEPFPVVYDENDVPVALPADMLPVTLPEVPDYSPRLFAPDDADSSPEAPLSRNEDWVNVTLDLGDGPRQYRRDTNTMPNWAGSCWYYLRYLDPGENNVLVDPELDRYWLGAGHGNQKPGSAGGVDLYIGGVEHAVLHLLYSRFWHKVLYDLGHVSSAEPFHRLFNQGYIQAYAFTDARGVYVPADEVVEDPASSTGYRWNDQEVNREYGKMGKSLRNSVTPDDMYSAYGADTLRVYEMSMGPLDLSRPWDTRSVVGSQRFLQRLWRNVVDETTGAVTVVDDEPDTATLRLMHQTIAGASEDMEGLRQNTAIAKLIVLNNHLTTLNRVPRKTIEALILMVAPIAPHIAEELWQRLGHTESLARESFPVADPTYLVQESVTCVVQVSGKVRARLEVNPQIGEEDLTALALAEPTIARLLGDQPPRRVIVRAPGLVNLVPA